MKRIWLVSLIVIIALIFTSIPAMAASQNSDDIIKLKFIQYPKHEAAKPAGGGGPALTGTLCPDYKYQGIHWATSEVRYYVNASGENEQGIKDSFATWNAASTGINFKYEGSSGVQEAARDNKNVVYWGPVEYSNAIAVTYFWYSRATKQIVEVDTVMNVSLPWAYEDVGGPEDLSGDARPIAARYEDPTDESDPDSYDVRNIMTHEAGHWILLNDLYNSRDSKLTMYGYGDYGEISKDTLGYGDELGIERVYGP
jgi:hypothetical protein